MSTNVSDLYGILGPPRDWFFLDLDDTDQTDSDGDYVDADGFRAICLASGDVVYRTADGDADITDERSTAEYIGPDGEYPGGFIQAIRSTSTCRTFRVIKDS